MSTALSNVQALELCKDDRPSQIAERAPMRTQRGIKVGTLPEAVEFAKIMCQAQQAIPKDFRGNPGICLALTMQALRWGFDPFGVAQNAYVVNDKVAYEAKLIVAAINENANLWEPLEYQYEGQGASRSCRVIGKIISQSGLVATREYETPPIGSITPKNSPLWKNDPDQQLAYFAARAWARRHCPEVLLGVFSRDELSSQSEPVHSGSSLSERLSAAKSLPPISAQEVGGEATQEAEEGAEDPDPAHSQLVHDAMRVIQATESLSELAEKHEHYRSSEAFQALPSGMKTIIETAIEKRSAQHMQDADPEVAQDEEEAS